MGLTLEDLPPDLDLRSAAGSGAAGVLGADACAATAADVESRESASEARRSLAASSRPPETAGRCKQRPAASALLAFLHTPSIARSQALTLAAADSSNELQASTAGTMRAAVLVLEEGCGGDGLEGEEEDGGKPVLKEKRSRHCRAVAAVGWACGAAAAGCACLFGLTSVLGCGRDREAGGGVAAEQNKWRKRRRRGGGFDYEPRGKKEVPK